MKTHSRKCTNKALGDFALKILIIDTIYASVMERIGVFNRPLSSETFGDLTATVAEEKFGAGVMYDAELSALGHEGFLVYANSLKSQLAWSESSRKLGAVPFGWRKWQLISRIPILGRFLHNRSTKVRILLQQIREVQPDVVYCLDINFLNSQLLGLIKKSVPIVVGQIASPLPPRSFYLGYDHIFSAHPQQVEHFRSLGISSSWLPLAFDKSHTREFDDTGWPVRSRDVTFVGSFGRHQRNTGAIMKAVGQLNPSLEIFTVTPASKLRRWGLASFYRGEAWGDAMRTIFAESKVVINRHGPIASGFAVNNRLFEATGMGAVLVTEDAKNIQDLFAPELEVVTYSSPADAAAKVQIILNNYEKYESVGRAGQARTWAEHTHANRAQVIDATLKGLMRRQGG